jgi:hypothetical protein
MRQKIFVMFVSIFKKLVELGVASLVQNGWDKPYKEFFFLKIFVSQ